jgi:nucleoside-diphosphate-sugar epimerase
MNTPTRNDELHVVVGAGGASGRLVVRDLSRSGRRVRAVTRNGRDVGTPGVELVSADALDVRSMIEACRGASTVYFCAMPVLHRWRSEFPVLTDSLISAAAENSARLVYADDTWMYGRVQGPMTEDTPYRPVSSKGTLRAWLAERILHAGDAGRLPVSIVRAGELYGPGVRSMIAGNVFAAAARGRAVRWFGNPDLPLTPTYIGDFARTLTAAGMHDSGRAETWHVPHPGTITGRGLAHAACNLAGTRLRLTAHGTRQVSLLGAVLPLAREGAELVYQFEQPFVVDGSRAASALSIRPTPYEHGIAATLAEHGIAPDRAETAHGRAVTKC